MVEVLAAERPSGNRRFRPRGRPWQRRFSVVLATGLLLASLGVSSGSQPNGSYQHLSDPAKMFIDQLYGDGDGQLDDAADYNALKESERTTFEAIMHALEADGLLHLVTSVTAIWGEIPRSTQGLDQFRVSVTLAEGAPERLRDNGFPGRRGSHVKLPHGDRVGPRETATARQSGGPPSTQVSWLKRDPTVGEIDIDYIPFGGVEFSLSFIANVMGFGHTSPQNSDVRADPPGNPPNYDVHVGRYGCLERWWTR